MNNAFIRSFGAAVSDVRERLISEGWFGRLEKPDYTGFGQRSPGQSMPSPEHQRLLHDHYKAFFEKNSDKSHEAPSRDAPARDLPGRDIER